jgi:LPXTG-site transpeptidase (sortase) family protein
MSRRRKLTILLSSLMVIAGIGVVLYAVFGRDDYKEPARPRVFTAPPVQGIPPSPIPEAQPTVEPTPAPSGAPLDRLIVPKAGVNESIRTFYLSSSGEMTSPSGSVVAWYDFCGPTAPIIWSGCQQQNLGPDFSRPGFGGNAVFAAHVYWQNVPSTFINLSKIGQGDEVQIRLQDGTLYRYNVIELQVYPPAGPHVESIIGPVGREVVTLITCYGFNPNTRDYDNRVVVVAERIPDGPAPAPASRAQ